jgi:galactose oxidase-like protein/Kelch motif protein
MRRVGICVVGVLFGGGASLFACVSSDNPVVPLEDSGGFELDAAGIDVNAFDTSVPIDSSAPIDQAAPIDSTLPQDSATPDVNSPPVDSGIDSSPIDAGSDATDSAAPDAGPGTLSSPPGLALTSFRQGHSSTLLADGRVLICGGYYGSTGSQSSCDLFDPTTTTITAGPSMTVGRQGQSATLLPNDQVLIAGGSGPLSDGGFNTLQSAEIFDPIANDFTLVSSPMAQARTSPAVLLGAGPNAGKVVLVGGEGDGTVDSGTPNDFSLASAEVFDPGGDPVSGTFTLLPFEMSVRRAYFIAEPLPEGGVLAAGGANGPGGGPYNYLSSAEILNPALTAFGDGGGAMSTGRQSPYATVMADGRIFVVGGYTPTGYSGTADIYDPATSTFSTVTLPAERAYMAIALLKSGRILIAGGVGTSGTLGDVILFDPTTSTFLTTNGTLNPPRALATATTLNDGRVVIAGGQEAGGMIVPAVDIFTE